MTPLWTATEAAATTGGTVRGDWQATGVSIDTRTLQPGPVRGVEGGARRA